MDITAEDIVIVADEGGTYAVAIHANDETFTEGDYQDVLEAVLESLGVNIVYVPGDPTKVSLADLDLS